MKMNSINLLNYNTKPQAFKHTAVPYPELENLYYQNPDSVNSVFKKVSSLFHPQVTKEAKEIKSKIDTIYEPKDPKAQLLSVLA